MTRSTDATDGRATFTPADMFAAHERRERMSEGAPEMYEVLRACVDAPQSTPALTAARDKARALLARLDGRATDNER